MRCFQIVCAIYRKRDDAKNRDSANIRWEGFSSSISRSKMYRIIALLLEFELPKLRINPSSVIYCEAWMHLRKGGKRSKCHFKWIRAHVVRFLSSVYNIVWGLHFVPLHLTTWIVHMFIERVSVCAAKMFTAIPIKSIRCLRKSDGIAIPIQG